DGNRLEQDVPVRDGLLGQHADIEWVLVAHEIRKAGPLRTEFADPFAAKRLRDQAVQSGTDVGVELRPIDSEQAGDLVQLVLDGIGGHDLDIRGDLGGRVWPDRYAMPGVSPKEQPQ